MKEDSTMAHVVGSLVGEKGFLADFFATTAAVAGQVLIRDATMTNAGEVADPASETSVLAMVGVAQNAATVDTTPAADPRYDLGGNLLYVQGSLENIVRVEINPFAIYRFPIAGGATAGTALAPETDSPANILNNDAADAAAPFGLITDTAVGGAGANMAGGLVKGRTGNNVGAIRKLSAHSNDTSTTVSIGFLNSLAVGDTFIRVPYSRQVAAVQLTTNFVEANGVIATGTGALFRVVAVHIDEQHDVAAVDCISGDHFFQGTGALT